MNQTPSTSSFAPQVLAAPRSGRRSGGWLTPLAWLLVALLLLPIVTVLVHLLLPDQGTWAHLASHRCCRTTSCNSLLAGAGRRPDRAGDRHRNGLADHALPLSRPRPLRVGADPAPGGAGLRHGLRLYRLAGGRRAAADLAARAVRLAGRRLLVPRGALAGRRHRPARLRALSLRLPAGTLGLPRAVGLRPRGQPHAGLQPLGLLLARRPAAGASGGGGRHRARPDGDPGRLRHGRLLRPADLHHRDRAGADLDGRPHGGGAALLAVARGGLRGAAAGTLEPAAAALPSHLLEVPRPAALPAEGRQGAAGHPGLPAAGAAGIPAAGRAAPPAVDGKRRRRHRPPLPELERQLHDPGRHHRAAGRGPGAAAGLWPALSPLAGPDRGDAGRRDGLCPARHRHRHRHADSAGALRQCRRRLDAGDLRHRHRAAADRRHRGAGLRLSRPLPLGLAGHGRGKPGQGPPLAGRGRALARPGAARRRC